MNISQDNTRSNVCRICLSIPDTGTSLFSGHAEILEKIYLCFQIILSNESYLPHIICNECIVELNMANKFRLKCVTFEERFTTYCNQNNLDTKVINYLNDDGTHECSADILLDIPESIPITTHTSESDLNQCIETNFKCDICNKVLKSKASLTKHTMSMHEKRKHVGRVTGSGVNRRYHCTKCLYSTPHSQTLVNHMRRHDGERPYHCFCGKNFTQSSSLSAHQKTHSDCTYYTCSICGKQFKHAYALKTHVRVHNDGTYICDICKKKLKSRQSLKQHMHRHYNIHNFNCEDCGATFVSCSELYNHRKKHSKEKRAECHFCGYKTRAKKNLIMHLKRHTGERAFKCDLCDITFYTRSDLRRHRRVHSREKPFPCPTCSQRFSHSPSLNKHMRNVHGMQYKWADFKNVHLTKTLPIKDEHSQ